MILVTYARLCLGEPGGHEPDLWGWRIAGDRTDYRTPTGKPMIFSRRMNRCPSDASAS
jgi:hypothetical protein